jgi:hypothetical protein
VFIAYFLNSAVILLLADANFTFYKFLKIFPVIGNGPYSDLSDTWYMNIAPAMIKTMIIKAFFDWIDMLIQFSLKIVFRAKD